MPRSEERSHSVWPGTGSPQSSQPLHEFLSLHSDKQHGPSLSPISDNSIIFKHWELYLTDTDYTSAVSQNIQKSINHFFLSSFHVLHHLNESLIDKQGLIFCSAPVLYDLCWLFSIDRTRVVLCTVWFIFLSLQFSYSSDITHSRPGRGYTEYWGQCHLYPFNTYPRKSQFIINTENMKL